MNTNTEQSGPTKMETLLGGVSLEVTYNDTRTETVCVRQLPVRLLKAYAAVLDDEPAMAELFCDKPAGWSDNLHPDSLVKIVEEGERVNESFFVPWYARRRRRQEKLMPDLNVDGIVARAAVELQSKTMSSNSPTPAGSGSARR